MRAVKHHSRPMDDTPPFSTGSAHARRRSHGFTLMEMLLVLVLVSLLFTLLMQGLTYFWHLQQRYDNVLNERLYEGMHAYWWRTSMRGLLIESGQGASRFQGDDAEIRGFSTFSLDKRPGVPAQIRWTIDSGPSESRLLYNGAEVKRWPGPLSFAYLDSKGERHLQWPPPHSLEAQLPHAILLLGQGGILHVASPSLPQHLPAQFAFGSEAFHI
ncbi:MAG: prepilin-type N-terminal cleavage/methylation domain-containing protein [Gammaproteobacteria bacterium]|nr:prepilin-type N-terminal cleavage/methylation domain-containing protein [Gammaproteobacteria bacterium]